MASDVELLLPSILTIPLLIAGRIDDPDHSLASRMYLDAPHFDCLLIAPSITVKSSNHLIMKPKKLDSVTAVSVHYIGREGRFPSHDHVSAM